jgi:hypothetical protein
MSFGIRDIHSCCPLLSFSRKRSGRSESSFLPLDFSYSPLPQSYLGNSKEANQLKALVSSHPQCSSVALSVWAAHTSPSPPIWVDIPVTVDAFTSSSSSESPYASSLEKSKISVDSSPLSMSSCLTQISSLLHSPKLRYSFHKAAMAKNILFW